MKTPWAILTKRYGEDIRQPSDAQLSKAIDELYIENLPGMTERDYQEHSEAFLRLGFDEGPMYVTTATRNGRKVILEEWKDTDYEEEQCPPKTMQNISKDQVFNLFKFLAQGNIDLIRNNKWDEA